MYGYIDGFDFGETLYVHCAGWQILVFFLRLKSYTN